jgi:hypothetical protein
MQREVFDVAVIELLDDEVKDALRLGWSSVPTSHVESASDDGTFFLFGYPTERLRPEGKTLMCGLITACSQRLAKPPMNAKGPIDPDVDLFFLYDDVAKDEDGDEVTSPHLRGVSGGGVWEVLEARSGLWTAEKHLRLVGVQSSAIHGEWFRAKSAIVALGAME